MIKKISELDKEKEDMLYRALDKARAKGIDKKMYVYHYMAYVTELSVRTIIRWIKSKKIVLK